MKKRISFIALLALVAALAFALAACGGGDETSKLEQSDFSIGISTPTGGSVIYVGSGPYPLRVLDGKTDVTSFRIVSGSDIISLGSTETGIWQVTPKAVGTAVIRGTRAADDKYNAKESPDLTIEVRNPEQIDFTFPTVTELSSQRWQPGGFLFDIEAVGGSGNGAFTYAVIMGPAELVGTRTIKVLNHTQDGESPIIVTATKAADGIYPEKTQTCTVNILKAQQGALSIAPRTNITVHSGDFNLALKDGEEGSGTGTYTYNYAGGPVSVTAGGLVHVTGYGRAQFTVTRAADSDYEEKTSAQLEINIGYTPQATPVIIEDIAPITFNPAVSQSVTVRASGGDGSLAYEIYILDETTGIATKAPMLDSSSASISITGAGNIKVYAVRLGNDDGFEDAVSEVYTIIVNKAAQASLTASAGTLTTYQYTNGLVLDLTVTGGSGEGAITYVITEGAEFVTGDIADGEALAGTSIAVAGAGTIKFKAVKAGDNDYAAAESAVVTITITKGTQQAPVFGSIGLKYYGDAPFNVTATGGESTAAIVYSVESGDAFIVLSDNTATILGAGAVELGAYKPGDANWEDSNLVTVNFTIEKGSQAALTVSIEEEAVLRYGEGGFTIIAEGGSGTGAVTFVVKAAYDQNIITLSGSAATIIGVGGTIVVVTKAGDSNYNEATEEINVTIGKGVQDISVSLPDDAVLLPGNSFDLVVEGDRSLLGAWDIELNEDSAGKDTISINGLTVTILTSGLVGITVQKAGDGLWEDSNIAELEFRIKDLQEDLTVAGAGVEFTPAFNENGDLELTAVFTIAVGGGTLRPSEDAVILPIGIFAYDDGDSDTASVLVDLVDFIEFSNDLNKYIYEITINWSLTASEVVSGDYFKSVFIIATIGGNEYYVDVDSEPFELSFNDFIVNAKQNAAKEINAYYEGLDVSNCGSSELNSLETIKNTALTDIESVTEDGLGVALTPADVYDALITSQITAINNILATVKINMDGIISNAIGA
ncbi:MAG: hypothetical protein LBT55_06415 [Clostridiaceae bacterium]|jgi:hypothetical protein|nr:hypothetical protein [Clostridiaceae bacterium]